MLQEGRWAVRRLENSLYRTSYANVIVGLEVQ